MARISKWEMSLEDITFVPAPVAQVPFSIMIAVLGANAITEVLTDILIRLNFSFGLLFVLLPIVAWLRLMKRTLVGWDVP